LNGRWVEAKGRKAFITAPAGDDEVELIQKHALKHFNLRNKNIDDLVYDGDPICLTEVEDLSQVVGPDTKKIGTLTEPFS